MPPTSPIIPPPRQFLVLLVEDDSHTREMYAEWLVYSGLRVAEATTEDDAMDKARRLRPHIIVTDIGLRDGGDGCRLCERLKADKATRLIPVIAVTAWTMGGHVERAQRAGCDVVLIKPCLPPDLLAQMHALLKGTEP